MTLHVDVFFDYLCPYVYRAALWLDEVERQHGDVTVRWRYFSLAQVNSRAENWFLWEQPLVNPEWGTHRSAKGLRAFWGAEAARRQGEDVFRRFHLALLRAYHEERLSLANDEALRAAAQRAELDMARWEEQRRDPALLDALKADHTEARERWEVFGTPTFLFPGHRPAYLKLDSVVPAEEAVPYWETFVRVVAQQPLFLEIKRPH
ncbi:MAG: DsbA family protein [Ardenticatenia bacterium]|nr:DsbA family protein [Ardenticatenia bacterium]